MCFAFETKIVFKLYAAFMLQARYRRMMLKLSASMPNFTLHYYAIRGYGELARLMFAHTGIQFTDHRMHWDEWQEEKKNSE